ncbi:MAG: hypothetical protein AAFW69_06730, partial [Pseudomonadota bacterium]
MAARRGRGKGTRKQAAPAATRPVLRAVPDTPPPEAAPAAPLPEAAEAARELPEIGPAEDTAPHAPPEAPAADSHRAVVIAGDPAGAGRPALRVTEGQQGLIVTGLRKSYRRRPVLRDVSLKLRRGEVVGLLGPNGAG